MIGGMRMNKQEAIESITDLKNDTRAKYNPPDYSKINCKCFGEVDGMNGSCHYCFHNNPYQFEMCSDEQWKNDLIKGGRFNPMTESEAIEFINDYKSKHYKR